MTSLLNAPTLQHLCDLKVDLAPPIEMGEAPRGRRRIIPIIGGAVAGERLNGRVLGLGADWQTIFRDGSAELDTRYAIETYDGATIEIRNFGFRTGAPDVIAALARGEVSIPRSIICAPARASRPGIRDTPGSMHASSSAPASEAHKAFTSAYSRYSDRRRSSYRKAKHLRSAPINPLY